MEKIKAFIAHNYTIGVMVVAGIGSILDALFNFSQTTSGSTETVLGLSALIIAIIGIFNKKS